MSGDFEQRRREAEFFLLVAKNLHSLHSLGDPESTGRSFYETSILPLLEQGKEQPGWTIEAAKAQLVAKVRKASAEHPHTASPAAVAARRFDKVISLCCAGLFYEAGQIFDEIIYAAAAETLGLKGQGILAQDVERGSQVRRAARKGGQERATQFAARHTEWDALAEEIWNKNPRLSTRDVARLIAARVGGSPETIRKRISAQRPSIPPG